MLLNNGWDIYPCRSHREFMFRFFGGRGRRRRGGWRGEDQPSQYVPSGFPLFGSAAGPPGICAVVVVRNHPVTVQPIGELFLQRRMCSSGCWAPTRLPFLPRSCFWYSQAESEGAAGLWGASGLRTSDLHLPFLSRWRRSVVTVSLQTPSVHVLGAAL